MIVEREGAEERGEQRVRMGGRADEREKWGGSGLRTEK